MKADTCLRLNSNPVIRAQKKRCCPVNQIESSNSLFPQFPSKKEMPLAASCSDPALDELFSMCWAKHTLPKAQDAPWDAGSAK